MIEAKVTGIPDLRAALAGIVPKLRVRALRNALAAGARVVQSSARAATPVINASALPVRLGYRKPGTVRKAISVRTSKEARKAGNVGVFVNVRPARGQKTKRTFGYMRAGRVVFSSRTGGALRGAKSAVDPYYWRFLNFGTRYMGARRFLEAGAAKLPQALAVFLAKIGPAIEKLNRPKAPAP